MTIWLRVVGVLALVTGLVLAAVAGSMWSDSADADTAQQTATDALLTETDSVVGNSTAQFGAPVARLAIPRLDDAWTVVEGVDAEQLALGPGHYPGTAPPGVIGNSALAGHRTGSMDVFRDLDHVEPCDVITVETRTGVYTYRVLTNEPRPGCPQVPGVPPAQVVGPDRGDLVMPVPGQPASTPTVALLTLTTCHPLGSNEQRLVIHAALVSASIG